jgi:hypothetical protein
VQTYRASILWKLVKSCVVAGLFEGLSLGGILGYEFRALYFAGFH